VGAVRQHNRLSLHGCHWEWMGVRCHKVLGVLPVQGRPRAVQLLGRRRLFQVPAGLPHHCLASCQMHALQSHATPFCTPQCSLDMKAQEDDCSENAGCHAKQLLAMPARRRQLQAWQRKLSYGKPVFLLCCLGRGGSSIRAGGIGGRISRQRRHGH
jgi:hypothetical protein